MSPRTHHMPLEIYLGWLKYCGQENIQQDFVPESDKGKENKWYKNRKEKQKNKIAGEKS